MEIKESIKKALKKTGFFIKTAGKTAVSAGWEETKKLAKAAGKATLNFIKKHPILSAVLATIAWWNIPSSDEAGRLERIHQSNDYKPKVTQSQQATREQTPEPEKRTKFSFKSIDQQQRPMSLKKAFGDTLTSSPYEYPSDQAFPEDVPQKQTVQATPAQNNLEAEIKDAAYQDGETYGFDAIGNGTVLIQDMANARNFVMCHVGFHPEEADSVQWTNVRYGYEVSFRPGRNASKRIGWQGEQATTFNVQMKDDTAFCIQFCANAKNKEDIVTVQEYDPSVPTYRMAQRDGVLVVRVDKENRMTAIEESPKAKALLNRAHHTPTTNNGIIYEDNFVPPVVYDEAGHMTTAFQTASSDDFAETATTQQSGASSVKKEMTSAELSRQQALKRRMAR